MTAGNELSCLEFVEIVTEYLEGTMPAEERARLENHLLECDGCTTYLEQMRQTIRLVGKLSESHVPSDAKETLLTAFRNFSKKRD